MEKIKLLNGHEYPIKEISQSGDSLIFVATGLPDFASFRGQLTPENLGTIETHTDGGALCAIFEGYLLTGKYDILETEEGLDITVYLKKEDELLKRIRQLEEEVAALKETGVK